MALFNFGKKKEEKKTPTCCCGSEPKVEESTGCCCGSAPKAEETTSCCGAPVEGICCIKVLGAGCKSCHEQYENAKAAVKTMGLDIEVEYITPYLNPLTLWTNGTWAPALQMLSWSQISIRFHRSPLSVLVYMLFIMLAISPPMKCWQKLTVMANMPAQSMLERLYQMEPEKADRAMMSIPVPRFSKD